MKDVTFDAWRHICPVCKKEFYVQDANSWVYKKHTKDGKRRYFCCYTCKRKYEGNYEHG